jgi:hypothetical protein
MAQEASEIGTEAQQSLMLGVSRAPVGLVSSRLFLTWPNRPDRLYRRLAKQSCHSAEFVIQRQRSQSSSFFVPLFPSSAVRSLTLAPSLCGGSDGGGAHGPI